VVHRAIPPNDAILFGRHSPCATSPRARASRPRTGATLSSADSSKSPSRSFRTVCALRPAFSASPESEMPRPRCAFPMISAALSSSGIILLSVYQLRCRRNAQTDNRIQRQFLKRWRDVGNCERFLRFLFHRCDRDVIDSARNNMIKRREIAAHVQREPVHGNPMANANTDRSDLAIFDPNSCERIASLRGNVVSGEKIDEQLLEPAQIFMQILAASPQVDNWITHQLARPVIRTLPHAVDRKEPMRQIRAA